MFRYDKTIMYTEKLVDIRRPIIRIESPIYRSWEIECHVGMGMAFSTVRKRKWSENGSRHKEAALPAKHCKMDEASPIRPIPMRTRYN